MERKSRSRTASAKKNKAKSDSDSEYEEAFEDVRSKPTTNDGWIKKTKP